MEFHCGKTPYQMVTMSSMMHTEPLSMIYEATRQTLRIDKFAPVLRVPDILEWPPKLCCWNVLAVLYSYENKECVCVKHIMFKIKFMLWKEKIQDQIISHEQVSTCGTANQRPRSSKFREPQSIWIYYGVCDLWILRAQN
jgi:hypothetical protein